MSDETENPKQIYWLDGFNGEAQGGVYLRNDIKTFFTTLAEKGIKPVAIVYDGTFNLEILVERTDYWEKHKEQKQIPESGDREK